jgi:hypothetical protein
MQRLANSAAFVDITLPFLPHCDTHQAAARVEPYQHRKYLYASNYHWIPSHLFDILVRTEALDNGDGAIVGPFTIIPVFKPRLICSGIKEFTFFIKSLGCVFAQGVEGSITPKLAHFISGLKQNTFDYRAVLENPQSPNNQATQVILDFLKPLTIHKSDISHCINSHT